VRAPSSFAISATTGAAQVPVPHHRPQVIKIISAHSKTDLISSLDSSAAFLPTSGSDHAHKPEVISFQILSFVGARELNNACASVLIEMNSTHAKPHSIILLTAFCHPPPTHTTFIFATGEIEFQIFTSSGPFEASIDQPESKLFNLSSLLVICFIIRKLNI